MIIIIEYEIKEIPFHVVQILLDAGVAGMRRESDFPKDFASHIGMQWASGKCRVLIWFAIHIFMIWSEKV